MNIEAFEQLIRVLEEVKAKYPESFSLSNWVETELSYDSQLSDVADENPDTPLTELVVSCGTTACACGWAGMDKWFLDKGFRFNLSDGDMLFDTEQGEEYGWGAVSKFFDISHDMADYLFSEYSYDDDYPNDVSIDSVIKRINEVIKGTIEGDE